MAQKLILMCIQAVVSDLRVLGGGGEGVRVADIGRNARDGRSEGWRLTNKMWEAWEPPETSSAQA